MAADFYRTNAYWGGTVTQPPLGPGANTAFPWDVDGDGTVEDGETIDLTLPENQFAEDGKNPSTAFKAAQDAWVKAHTAYLNAFIWSTGSMKFRTYFRSETSKSNAFDGSTNTPAAEISPIIAHAGYVQLSTGFNQNGGIGFDNDDAPNTTATTAQTLIGFDPGYTGGATSIAPVIFHNIRVAFTKAYGGDAYKLSTPVGGAFGKAYFVAECTVDGDKVTAGKDAVDGAYYASKAEAQAAAQALTGKVADDKGGYTAPDNKTYTVSSANVTLPDASAAVLPLGQVMTYTQMMSRTEPVNGDVLSVYKQLDKVYEVASNYNAAEGSWDRVSYVGYGNNKTGDLRMYAYRRYNRTLTADEMLLNHTADLLKWFKLDIKAYTNLPETDRLAVAEAMRDFTFDSDRDTVAAALCATCNTVAYDFLLENLPAGEAYNNAAAFVTTAKQFQLSVSKVKLLNETYRAMVYTAVNGFGGIKTADTLQKVIDDKLDEIVETYYGKYLDKNVYDYRDLYVRQDEIYLAIDFFDAKATDGAVYVGKSYEDWEERYNAFAAKEKELKANVTVDGVTVPYWQTVKDGAGNQKYETLMAALVAETGYASATDLEKAVKAEATVRPNNWTEMLEKYLWKGNTEKAAESLEPLDLGGTYYHDNIRYYGDGTLVCPKNNSIMAHMSDQNSDVTYQVVGKVAGNWQLRGFRMAFEGNTKISSCTYAGLYVSGTEEKPVFSVNDSRYGLIFASEDKPTVSTVNSVDITVALDKRPAIDADRYYSYEWNAGSYTVKEVPAGTPGAYGPVTHIGSMDMSIFMNGQEKHTLKNAPYMSNMSDALGNSGANTYYAIRVYECALNGDEVRQNHFADLAGLYDLNLSLYYRLNEADRKQLHKDLAGIELGVEKSVAVAAYERAISANYYEALNVDSEIGEAFMALAETYFLDITSLLSVSSATKERIYAAVMNDPDVASGASWLTPILQGKLEETVAAIVEEHYAESILDTLIDLEGYQINLYGDKPGMRGLFSVDERQLGLLSGHYSADEVSVTLGMMLLPKDNAYDAVTVENGEIKLPESVIDSVVAYEDGYTDKVFYMNDKTVYTVEYYPEGEDVNKAVAYVGYICIQIEGEEPVIGYARYNGNIAKGNAFSLTDLAVYVKENHGMAHKNVQVLTNAAKDEAYISLIAGKVDLSEYVICVDPFNYEALPAFQAVIAQYLGITLKTVDADKVDTVEHVLYLGQCDTVHEGEDLYGIEVRGDNLYLFYKDAANADATIARFATILDMAYAEGYYQMAVGTSYVYHARGLAE